MQIIILGLLGFLLVSTVATGILQFFLGANGTDDEVARRIQRDHELVATNFMLTHELGRQPTSTELWEAAPPWFNSQETA